MNTICFFSNMTYNLSSTWTNDGKKSFTITSVLVFLFLLMAASFKILGVFV